MAIPTIIGYTGVIPDRRTQSAEEFTSAAVTWTDYQAETLVPSTNAAIDGINAAQDEILASVNNAEESSFIAQAAANYQGPWFIGAQVVKGESWSHNGLMWAANLTGAGEPQENAQWFLLKSEPELSAIKVMLEQWGYRYVGLFENGFTYSQVGDAGVDANNNAWIYTGAGAPSKAVSAGAVPSVGSGYEQVVFNSADAVVFDDGETVQGFRDNLSDLDMVLNIGGRTQEEKNSENLTIADFGDVGGANASAAINAMIQELGYFTLPAGSFNVQDQLIVPATAYDRIYSGKGMGYSKLNAVNMAGSSLIVNESPESYIKTAMRDFAIGGDVDSCIDFNLTGGYQLYNSEFRNLFLTSQGDAAFKSNQHFSTSWTNVHFSSSDGDAMEIQGGNSTILTNCYAHGVGQGKAGYRIKGNAVMLACNGIDTKDKDCFWGHFGSLSENQAYNIIIIGGNAEDWNLGMARLENFGWLTVDGQTSVTRGEGTWESYIDAINGSSHKVTLRGRTGLSSKGSVFGSAYPVPIASSGSFKLKHESATADSIFSKFYRKDLSLTYSGVEQVIDDVQYATQGLVTNAVKSSRDLSYKISVILTIPDGSITSSAKGYNCLKTANTRSQELNSLSGGEDGQELKLLVNDNFTKIMHDIGGAGRFILKSGADETAIIGDVYIFIYNLGAWVQI